MSDEIVPERNTELLRLLAAALEIADNLDEIDVAIRISEAIDLLERPLKPIDQCFGKNPVE